MNKSSFPEPPILADLEKARNCFGLNATVLPGLGTFRSGRRFRGFCEMVLALVELNPAFFKVHVLPAKVASFCLTHGC